MLRDHDAIATVAVKDLGRAMEFYGSMLGLRAESSDQPDVLTYRCGGTQLFVYKSEFAGTNQATCVTWNVGSHVEEIVRDLKAKGIDFEHYDMPGIQLRGDVHVGGDMKVAWFKDPEGNILAVVGS